MPTLTLNDHSISYRDAGDGPAVILIPGWNEDWRMYKHVAPALATRYRVLSLDWRGHGEDRALHGDFTIDDMAADIAAFVDALGLDTAYTVSSSHGGWANIEAAQRLGADRVPKIVLVSWLLFEPSAGLIKWSQEGQQPETWEATRQGFLDFARSTSTSDDIATHVEQEMKEFGEPYWRRTWREIWAGYTKWGTVAKRLEALEPARPIAHVYTVPHDPGYLIQSREFAEAHPWFTPIRVPGEAHFPALENPHAVARAIHEFLSDSELPALA